MGIINASITGLVTSRFLARSQTCLNQLFTVHGIDATAITKIRYCVLSSKELNMPKVVVRPTALKKGSHVERCSNARGYVVGYC